MMATPRPQLSKKISSYTTRNLEQVKAKGSVVIELPYSREYIPNSGPTPGPITFAPPADSTGYIIERILLPPDARGRDGKPKPRRPTYIVGWRDTPGARLLVPVMDILDYVSEWEVEKWETNLEMELKKERQKIEEEKQREKEALAQPNHPAPIPLKRKKGRPKKNAGIETAAMAELDPEDDGTTRLKGGAMGITPQKVQLEEFVGISDTDGTPSRQLAADQGEVMEHRTEGDEVDLDEEFFDAEETGEDDRDSEKQIEEILDQAGLGFGNAEGEWGSLPPLDMQHTMPDEDATPRPAKLTSQSQPPVRHTLSSWVTAGVSPYKTKASQETTSGVPTIGNSKLSQATIRLSSEDDILAEDETAALESSIGKAKKHRRKSSSADKVPKPKKRKRAHAGAKPVEVEGEQQWIVKRIDDAELFDVEGVGLVKMFKVLWEGDWPEDQNPTWEPEDSLPPELVRNYYKRSKDRLSKTQRKKKIQEKLKQTTLSWGNGKKYDSVGHAFAGDEDADLEATGVHEDEVNGLVQDHEDVDDGEDELLVVDQDRAMTPQSKFSWAGKRSGIFGMG